MASQLVAWLLPLPWVARSSTFTVEMKKVSALLTSTSGLPVGPPQQQLPTMDSLKDRSRLEARYRAQDSDESAPPATPAASPTVQVLSTLYT